MTPQHLRRVVIIAAVLFTSFSLYVYARFTVDDAFITWRYGKNLIVHGIWNYSPSSTDPTQAYTNPIFALLGVIPPAFGWDVVLFFKLVSLTIYASLLVWMVKISSCDWLMVLLFIGLPASVVHTFSGLETMFYVFLVAALLVALHQARFYLSLVLGLLLFVTRPEAWTLMCALPAYWYFVEPSGHLDRHGMTKPVHRLVICLAILGLPLAGYFGLHVFLFGNALPNTFYAKAGADFRPEYAFKLALYTLPIILVLRNRHWPLFGVFVMLFGGMIFSYSSSDLQMNYSHRFAFQVFGPSYIFGLYFLSLRSGSPNEEEKRPGEGKPGLAAQALKYSSSDVVLRVALVALLAEFFFYSGKFPGMETTYYQRTLAAHGALGKKISEIASRYDLKSFSVGDAGILPYRSDLCVLDHIGLASAKLTRGGPGDALFDSYGLEMIIFYTKNGEPDLKSLNQRRLFSWAEKTGMFKIGDLYWSKDYVLAIYAKRKMPEIEEVCADSRRVNSILDSEMRRATLFTPPWAYWHE